MKKAGTNKGDSKSFEEILRQKLDGVHAAPKSSQWDRLEAGLDQHAFKKHDRKFYYALAAAILLLLVSGGVLLLNNLKPGLPGISQMGSGNPAVVSNSKQSAEQTPVQPEPVINAAPDSPTTESSPANNESVNPGQKYAQNNTPAETLKQTPNTIEKKQPVKSTKAIIAAVKSDSINQEKPASAKETPVLIARNRKSEKQKPVELIAGISAVRKEKPALIASGKTHTAEKNPATVTGKENSKPRPVIAGTNSVAKANQTIKTEKPVIVAGNDQQPPTRSASAVQPIENPNSVVIAGKTKPAFRDSVSNRSLVKTQIQQQPTENNLHPVLSQQINPDSVKDGLQKQLLAGELTSDSTNGEKNKRKLKNSFSLGAFAGLTYFDQNIKLNEQYVLPTVATDPLFPAAVQDFEDNTRPAFSYHGGFTIGKDIIKGLKVETGFGFSHLAAATSTNYTVADIYNTGSGVVFENSRPVLIDALEEPEDRSNRPESITVNSTQHTVYYKYKYLHIPFRMQAFIDGKKLRYFVGAGLQASKLFENEITTNNSGIHTQKKELQNTKEFFRPWLYSGSFSSGVGYHLTENILVHGTGEFNTFFSPITSRNKIHDTKQNSPITFQISLGLTYSFLKK